MLSNVFNKVISINTHYLKSRSVVFLHFKDDLQPKLKIDVISYTNAKKASLGYAFKKALGLKFTMDDTLNLVSLNGENIIFISNSKNKQKPFIVLYCKDDDMVTENSLRNVFFLIEHASSNAGLCSKPFVSKNDFATDTGWFVKNPEQEVSSQDIISFDKDKLDFIQNIAKFEKLAELFDQICNPLITSYLVWGYGVKMYDLFEDIFLLDSNFIDLDDEKSNPLLGPYSHDYELLESFNEDEFGDLSQEELANLFNQISESQNAA